MESRRSSTDLGGAMMTRYQCEGGKGCMKPCELEDFTGYADEPNTEGFCRFTGEPKHWDVVR